MPDFHKVFGFGTLSSAQVTKREKDVRGCNACPLNGKTKLMGLDRVSGKKAFMWALMPSQGDVKKQLEFSTGEASDFLWSEMNRIGLSRKDFDIQFLVRCRATEKSEEGYAIDRAPNNKEIKCCSLHTDAALSAHGSRSHVWLVFGYDAGKTLFPQEFKKDRPIFWSDKRRVMVFCLDHPRYMVRDIPKYRLRDFRRKLLAFKFQFHNPGRFSFINAQDYKGLHRPESVKRLLDIIRSSKERPAIDIEHGVIDGQKKLLMVGFCLTPGVARSVIVDHGESKATKQQRDAVVSLLQEYLEDSSHKKIFQYGSSDVRELKSLVGVKVKGYNYDSLYASYMERPFQGSYGLDTLSSVDFPEFSGYKRLLGNEPDMNYANIPLATLMPYNCVDADITKRKEKETRDFIRPGLMQTYIWAGFTVDAMEQRGPFFDKKYLKDVASVIPKRLKMVEERLKVIAGKPNFNPNASLQCAQVMFDQLKLREVNGRSTGEAVLSVLAKRHEFPALLGEQRRLKKMDSTYLANYQKSADMNGGSLRTKWFLTGAATGRLRSGGSKKGYEGRVNFQNLHGDPLLENLLVSDLEWSKVLNEKATRQEIDDLVCFLSFDYSQIEIRMLAEAAGETLLLKQFETGMDIHSLVGHELTGEPVEAIANNRDTRTAVKAIHFGIIYGLGDVGLYEDLRSNGIKVTLDRVKELKQAYFKRYRFVRQYIQDQIKKVEELGEVETLFGFVRPILGDYDERGTYWGNQAVNTPIQGSAHQLLLNAMALLHTKPKQFDTLSKLVAEIHDALLFFVPLGELRRAYDQGMNLLQKAVPEYCAQVLGRKINVPLVADAKAGFRYGTLTKYKGESNLVFLDKWREDYKKIEHETQQKYFKVA